MTSTAKSIDRFAEDLKPIQQKYVATYIQRLYLELEKIKTIEELDKLPHHLGMFHSKDDTGLDILKRAMYNAMERRDLICDYKDTQLPMKKRGICQDENHYENVEEDIVLTDKERKQFDKINEKHGWVTACSKFDYRFNPTNQELTLVLGYDEDNSKMTEDGAVYVCKTCLEVINDNADGIVECDMESYKI